MKIDALPTNLDISEDTNLAVSTPITLTDDTIGFDPTAAFFDTRTWGSGAGDVTWEFNVSGTNPVITFGDDLTTFSSDIVMSQSLTVTNNSVLGSDSAVFQPNADSTTFFQVLDADGGIPVFNVDSTNERVGIGKADPDFKIHLVTTDTTMGRFETSSTDVGRFEMASLGNCWMVPISKVGGKAGFIFAEGAGNFGWTVLQDGTDNSSFKIVYPDHGGTEMLVIDTSGAVFIPQGNVFMSQDLTVDTTTLVVNSTTRKVGIGTVSPNAPLEVKGLLPGEFGGYHSGLLHVTNADDSEFANAVITGHNSDGGNTQLWYLGSTTGDNYNIAFINRQNGPLALWTNNTERFKIEADGDIGMSESLEVTGTGKFATIGLGGDDPIATTYINMAVQTISTGSTPFYGVNLQPLIIHSGNTTEDIGLLLGVIEFNHAFDVGIACGVRGAVGAAGSFSGTIAQTVSFDASAVLAAASGTITDHRGLWVRNPTVSAGTLVTNSAIFLDDQTTGGTNWQIFSEGGASYFGGTDGIYLGQTDGAEKITSDADGTLDLYAGTSIVPHANIVSDNFGRFDNGVGIRVDPTALTPIHVLGNRTGQVSILVKNEDGGTTSFARTLVLNDNSVELSTIAHSSGSTASRFGQANLANTGELICVGGPLIVGTIGSDALIFGTNSEVAITIHGTSQEVTIEETLLVEGSFTAQENVFLGNDAGDVITIIGTTNATGTITATGTIAGSAITDEIATLTGGNLTDIGTIGAAGDDDLLTLSSGLLTIRGDTLWVGDGTGLVFGSFFGNDINFVVAGGTGTYSIITDAGIAVGQTNNTTFQNNQEIDIGTFAGKYDIKYSCSVKGTGAGKHMVAAIGVDVGGVTGDVAQGPGRSHSITLGNSEMTLCSTAILDLSADDEVSIMITNETDNSNITVEHVNLVIVQIGGT